jgi:glycerol-3-phosphate acyltransferase PlsY
MLPFLLLAAAYLIGALPFGYLVARLIKGIDIRQHGSGNIGATNVGRVLGWPYFALVFALDFAKGAGPVLLILLVDPGAADSPVVELTTTDWSVLAGLCAIVGHMWPIYLGFKGGKGVATAAGVVAVIVPLPLAVAALCWLISILLTRFVSLSSILAGIMLCVAQVFYTWPESFARANLFPTSLCLAGAALVIVRHRGNIVRLLKGTEPRVGEKAPNPQPLP